jgi:hypothetical protein
VSGEPTPTPTPPPTSASAQLLWSNWHTIDTMDIWRDGDFATSIDTVGWRSVALDTVSSEGAATLEG